MHAEITANQFRGRAVGAYFLAGFGALWMLLSLYVWEDLTPLPVLAIASGACLLALAGLMLMRVARRFPLAPEDPRVRRAFRTVNAAQWIVIFAVCSLLNRFGLGIYTPTAVALIVGAHFFPLARLFRYPLHHVTGAAMIAWAGGAAVLAPKQSVQGITAAGAGLTLWIMAAVSLTLSFRAAWREAPAGLAATATAERLD